MNSAVFTLFLIAIAAHSGESIRCYICNSLYDSKCEDNPFARGLRPVHCNAQVYEKTLKEHTKNPLVDAGFHTEMSGSMFRCLKLDVEVAGKKIVTRSCVPSKHVLWDPCEFYETLFSAAGSAHCDVCKEDGCNGATASSPNLLHIFLLVVTAFVLTAYRPVI